MRKVPKKLRKALRRLPACNNKRDHRHNIAKAAGRYDRAEFHPIRHYWSYKW